MIQRGATILLVLSAILASSPVYAEESTCKTFADLYGNGRNLCENLFSGAFKYVPKSDPAHKYAYTMWFFDTENPNDNVTALRIEAGLHDSEYDDTDVCHLQYEDNSHDVPQANRQLPECSPWNSNSCCTPDIVQSPEYMREAYGAEFNWNRCGTLSQQCERFFVQEYCLYECDVNAGLFRKYAPHLNYTNNPDANAWEMEGMPIKGEYCDAWYEACQNDYFISCSDSDNGDWFACPSITPATEDEEDRRISKASLAVIIVLAVLASGACCWTCMLIRRERMGQPVFAPENFDKIGENNNRPSNSGEESSRGSIAMT
mmetsp:Transcript_15381/g.29805  ORF Transcript_15381/g.29805 Transcript_15381/m.29805 type:complete len:317 (-) Transcript_15381:522-1472(-)|eukprot:CAMPEP_0171499794 /NCGR_PEP_ID=MMETSP0958-20121227/8626_1 /TAXON_ID=87120 /ORGANISM="Aurantiochytrium limacinum, Strain ATCCMYA-1381" /LENGTH=316 /DNA_ID=CAMNT_0012034389 /DNA_START=42 /DNA_END=992 /DNA_ORIENTATION=+